MATVLDLVKHYQHAIEKYSSDEQKVLKSIDKLYHLDVTVQHLQETGVGRTVNGLRKEPGDVGHAARALVYKWKLMVAAEESDQEGDHNTDTTTYNGHENGKDSDDNAKQQPKNKYERYEKSTPNVKSEHKEHNGNYSGGKRKYHSSEDDEPDIKKSKGSTNSHDDYKDKSSVQVKREYSESEEESGDSDNSRSEDSESESSREEKEIKIKQEIKQEPTDRHKSSSSRHSSSHKSPRDEKREPSSSQKSHDSEKHARRPEISESSEKHSSHKSKEKSHSSENHKISRDKDKSDKNSKSDSSSEKDKKQKEDSKSSSKHKSSSDKLKSSTPENGNEKHKSNHEKHSIKSDKHRSSSHSKSEKEKHKSSSDKEIPEEKHKSKHSSSSKEKHSSSRKERSKDRSSSSKEKTESSSKESHQSHKSDKKHSSSSDSKSKHSDSKHKSERHDDGNSETKSKHKSSSSSSNKNKSSSSKSKDEIPKKKNPENVGGDSDDGIDCGSGASFAEALGMVSPVKPKKKLVPTRESFTTSSSNSNDLSPANLLASTAKLAPLPALEISALPEISPNYKPRPPPKLMPHFSDEEAMSTAISSKNQRTKVYSGNKVIGKIPSLYEMCVQILQEHIDALEYTGGVPYDILKPVVDRATPQQLFVLEHYNPYLMEDTDHLWQKCCEKNFRTKQRKEMETWREMYLRCQEEQESRLKSLTANIRMTQEAKKAPIKQTKMAYVDSTVKPPRNIARKQAQHGTAHSATASPAARVASLAAGPNVLRGGARPSPSVPLSSSFKPKKAPLMQKALQFMRGRKR